jgi:hypothetical protein
MMWAFLWVFKTTFGIKPGESSRNCEDTWDLGVTTKTPFCHTKEVKMKPAGDWLLRATTPTIWVGYGYIPV